MAWKKVKKLVNRMHRDGVKTKDMKQYLTFVNPKAGTLKGNPKLYKRSAPFKTIEGYIKHQQRRWQNW